MFVTELRHSSRVLIREESHSNNDECIVKVFFKYIQLLFETIELKFKLFISNDKYESLSRNHSCRDSDEIDNCYDEFGYALTEYIYNQNERNKICDFIEEYFYCCSRN